MTAHDPKSWRRRPESNRDARICNPEQPIENSGEAGKRSLSAPDDKSRAYEAFVNGRVIHPAALYLQMILITKDAAALRDLAMLWRANLSPNERTLIALAALFACDEPDAIEIARAATSGGWAPPPDIPSTMTSARAWAAGATALQRRATAAAAIEAMSAKDRAALIAWVADWEDEGISKGAERR